MKRLITYRFCFVMLLIHMCSYGISQNNNVTEKAENYIISEVGQEFYEKYISISQGINNKNWVIFNFKLNDSLAINKLIIIYIDSSGEIDTENSKVKIKQLSECIENPTQCYLPMDKNSAIEIAKKEGLAKGVNAWKVSLVPWGDNKLNLKWIVKNTIRLGSQGEIIAIRAITGEVEHLMWETESCGGVESTTPE